MHPTNLSGPSQVYQQPQPAKELSLCEKIMAVFCCCMDDSDPIERPLLHGRVDPTCHAPTPVPLAGPIPSVVPDIPGTPDTPARYGASGGRSPSPLRTPPPRTANGDPATPGGTSSGRESSTGSRISYGLQYGIVLAESPNSSVDR